MDSSKEVIIIGGGLAGLTAAIHLSGLGIHVTVIEKQTFPKHKVCGEYISKEVLPYMKMLGVDLSQLQPSHINKIQFSITTGKAINGKLPLGGFGISRYVLDEFLYKKAIANGCKIISETVESIFFKDNQFTITTLEQNILKSNIVLGAFGKRSNIDLVLERDFVRQKSPWLAVKAHYSGDFPNDLVGLHNFNGGYCGVSKVENDIINICYLADYKTFKKYKNIDEYEKQVVCRNPHLQLIFKNCKPLFDKPLTISQISFERKKVIENHIIMIGDTAGLIHPLCGNGMAMAIHSAKIAAELVEQYFKKNISRIELEQRYILQWNRNFKNRITTGRLIAVLLRMQKFSQALMSILIYLPFLLSLIIKKTHGKPIIIKS